MRTIKNEVEQYMTALSADGATVTSRFRFPEEFIGFQGHFPEKKVLPGVCQIQCALTTLEKAKKKPALLLAISQAKYLLPVLPGEEIACLLTGVQEGGEFTVKTVLTKQDTKIAEFKLLVRV